MFPTRVKKIQIKIDQVDLGDLHSALVSQSGALFTFGDN